MDLPEDQRKNAVFAYSPASVELDPVNMRILEELQREPRLTMAELGRRVGMSSPAVTERVRRLEESNIITGYRLDLNPAALGLPVGIYIRVRPHAGQLQQILRLLEQVPEVVECHRITGEDCLILKAHIPSIDQLDRLLDRLLMYGSTTTSVIQSSTIPVRSLPLCLSDS